MYVLGQLWAEDEVLTVQTPHGCQPFNQISVSTHNCLPYWASLHIYNHRIF